MVKEFLLKKKIIKNNTSATVNADVNQKLPPQIVACAKVDKEKLVSRKINLGKYINTEKIIVGITIRKTIFEIICLPDL